MKAILLTQLHQPLQYTDVPTPTPGPGHVLVRLKAAALNHRDVFIREGLYPNIKLPVVLGSDGAGDVVAVGEGVSEHWLHRSVVINPGQDWGDNPRVDGPAFRILGMPDNGTFAEYIAVNSLYVSDKPQHLTYAQAAALPLAGLTAWRALTTRARLQPGERVLITGIGGGAALLALQFAVAMGANVWVTSGSDAKLQTAYQLGASGGVNYRQPDWPKQLLTTANAPKSGFFDVIIDSAGGSGFAHLISLAAPGGRIVFYGGTNGTITDLVPAKIFFKQLDIMGTTMGNPAEFAAMLGFVDKHQLVPVLDQSFPLANAEAAFERMASGQQTGKLILTIESAKT